MKRSWRVDLVVLLGSVLPAALALSACGTHEVEPGQIVISPMPADPTQGGLLIVVAPSAATYDQVQADARANKNDPGYHVLIDGKELAWDDTYVVRPLTVSGGGQWSAGFHDAGMHHFTLVAPGGATAVAADGVIASAALTRLYVFGPPDAREARVVSYPFVPPAGKEHVSAINMVRDGDVQIEIVACTDATTCAAVSPALGLGETFDADLEGGATSAAAGYAYRQVATASLPAPPVLPISGGDQLVGPDPGVAPAALIAAPIYMAPDGTALQWSN
jgi:hypothetical protein